MTISFIDIEAIPNDLREDLAVLAELLPAGRPIPYSKAQLLVHSWRNLSDEALIWSGAEMVIRIDLGPYHSMPDLYGAPSKEQIDYSVDLWRPFSDQWRSDRYAGLAVGLFELAAYLKLVIGTWGKSPVARRRHVRKDRLDGLGLGCLIHPNDSTASIYLRGARSLPEIVEADLRDQVR